NVSVEFAEAGVDAVDNIFEVLVDQHRPGAEDDQIEEEDGQGLIKITLLEDPKEDLFYLAEINCDRSRSSRIDPSELKTKPRRRRIRYPVHNASSKISRCKCGGRIEDVLIDRATSTHLIRGNEPFISAWEVKIREFAPMDPPGIAV